MKEQASRHLTGDVARAFVRALRASAQSCLLSYDTSFTMETRFLSSLGASSSSRGMQPSCSTLIRAHSAQQNSERLSDGHSNAPRKEVSLHERRGLLHMGALLAGNLCLSQASMAVDQSDKRTLEVCTGLSSHTHDPIFFSKTPLPELPIYGLMTRQGTRPEFVSI